MVLMDGSVDGIGPQTVSHALSRQVLILVQALSEFCGF